MEEEETQAEKDANSTRNLEEMRLKRLAYFQGPQTGTGQATTNSDRASNFQADSKGTNSQKEGKQKPIVKTSEFRMSVNTEKEEVGKRKNNQSVSYTKISLDSQPTGSVDASKGKRRSSSSSISDSDLRALVTPTRPAVSVKPSVSSNIPQYSKNHESSFNRGRGVSNENIWPSEKSQRVVRNSGDSEVENLFSNRKWVSGNEIPPLSLKESVDIDSVSVFKSNADFDNLGLSTHRPESETKSNVFDFADRKKAPRQRSVSSESLLLGAKAEDMRNLLGERKYREFVEKSERELNQLHKLVEESPSPLQWKSGSSSERSSRIDGPARRNTPTPPLNPPCPQPAGTSNRGPSPRRRLRSSSPQMVSKTLQDIARTKEVRESNSARNYEQVVVPHNVTFSADEIYRQAYGPGNGGSNDVRKSSISSVSSSYQDPSTAFWNTVTPRQMVGSMSPSTPHGVPMYQQPHFMPVNVSGIPVHTQPPPQPVYAASPTSSGAYFYPQCGVPMMNMAGGGGGGGQFAYPRQQNIYMGVPPGTPPQSPDSYPYHHHGHPLSQNMPHAPGTPAYNPAGMSWQYAPGQFVATPHPPAEHAEAVRHHHEQRRHVQENQAHNNVHAPGSEFSATSIERYFASLGMSPPPNYPPPSYNVHQPPPTHHPPPSHHHPPLHHHPPPNQPPPSSHPPQQHRYQESNRQSADVQQSYDSSYRNSADMDDDDDMTTVTRTSIATGTSIVAGGITERMEQLGVDPQFLNNLKQRTENLIADEEALDAIRNKVRVCPECQAVNKEYMTWCLQCGGVLIGVDPIPMKDLKKKSKEKKSGNADSSSRHKKSHSRTRSGDGERIPISVQHYDGEPTDEPLLEYEEKVEIIYEDVPTKQPYKDLSSKERSVKDGAMKKHQRASSSKETPVRDLTGTKKHQPDYVLKELSVEDVEDSRDTFRSFFSEEHVMDNVDDTTRNLFSKEFVVEDVLGLKESPESGRGASENSSPARRKMSREVSSEDVADLSQSNLEVTENKDSGRPSSGEDTRKPQLHAQLVPDNGPRRSNKEISDICEVINDPIIRGFIKNYLEKKSDDTTPEFSRVGEPYKESSVQESGAGTRTTPGKHNTVSMPAASGHVTRVKSATSKSAALKSAPPAKKSDTPKKKKKAVKKGHEAIDVEIFGMEEARLCRSSRSGANLVPKLNLVNTSDEDDSSEQTDSLQGGPSLTQGPVSDASTTLEDLAPVNYDKEMKVMTAGLIAGKGTNNVSNPPPQNHTLSPSHNRNEERANSNFQFLQQLVEADTPKASPPQQQKKRINQARPTVPQGRPSPTSKVRASIDAPPPNRRWMRSSTAWSSYNPRELRTRSSCNFQQRGGAVRQSAAIVQASQSTDNLADLNRQEMPPSQRPRPASADLSHRRGANRGRPSSGGRGGRPYSAGHFVPPQSRQQIEPARSAAAGDHVQVPQQRQGGSESNSNGNMESPRSPNTDIEGRPIHRLTVQENTLPLIPAGPSTALKIYDRCFEVTPRDELEGQDSKWLFLPDELWLHVFSFLPQLDLFHVTLSCKQLHCIALDPNLWKRVTVRKKPMSNEWLSEIAKRHPVSMAMIQCHGDNVSENTLRDFFKEIAPKVEELNFSRCSKGKLIGDEILLHASTHCRHLTHVDASWCHVTDVGLTALAGCCHRLESLCLNGCQQISDESLKAVVEKHGASLRVLELFGCFSLTPISFRHLAEHCTFLLTLNMGQCYKISDSHMITLSASLSRVETLDLRGCKKLGDNSIRKIVKNCRRLRHLTLANCPLLSNAAVVEIATYLPDIRSLDVCGCNLISDTSLRTLASNCYRMTSIDISSTSCTHKSVLMLAESCRNLESAKFNFLADIHDTSLSKLIKSCKRLNTIHLYGCNVRDAEGLKRFNRFVKIEM
ncbi:uncharacterized protein [Littorina saxatilis]|uniref:F-box domain-containing protein n=1 Tax=Littorina saxatilis TaxID=31220 RepID=A0AAN9G875_9CAEN